MSRNTLDTPATGDAPAPSDAAGAVPPRKFVHVIERHANGLVRFDFAVGWPDLSCELVLPQPMFDDFCRDNAVEFLTQPADDGINTLPSPEPSQP